MCGVCICIMYISVIFTESQAATDSYGGLQLLGRSQFADYCYSNNFSKFVQERDVTENVRCVI